MGNSLISARVGRKQRVRQPGAVDFLGGGVVGGWVAGSSLDPSSLSISAGQLTLPCNVDVSDRPDVQETLGTPGVGFRALLPDVLDGGKFGGAALEVKASGLTLPKTAEYLSLPSRGRRIAQSHVREYRFPHVYLSSDFDGDDVILEVEDLEVVLRVTRDAQGPRFNVPAALGMVTQDGDWPDTLSGLLPMRSGLAMSRVRWFVDQSLSSIFTLDASLLTIVDALKYALAFDLDQAIPGWGDSDSFIGRLRSAAQEWSATNLSVTVRDSSRSNFREFTQWHEIGRTLHTGEGDTAGLSRALVRHLEAQMSTNSRLVDNDYLFSRMKGAPKPLQRLDPWAAYLASPVLWKTPTSPVVERAAAEWLTGRDAFPVGPLPGTAAQSVIEVGSRARYTSCGQGEHLRVYDETFMPTMEEYWRRLDDLSIEMLERAHDREHLYGDAFRRVPLVPFLHLPPAASANAVALRLEKIATYLEETCHFAEAVVEESPLVSVVMPVRNRPEGVAAAVRSCQSQTYSSWELVIVDDGSVDQTLHVLAAIEDERVRILRTGPRGAAAARNAGLSAARGEFVAWLDSDAVLLSSALWRLVAACNADTWIYGQMALFGGTELHVVGESFDMERLMYTNFIDQCCLLVSRDLANRVGGYRMELSRAIDYDFILRLAREAQPCVLPEVVAVSDAVGSSHPRITQSESPTWTFSVQNEYLDWSMGAETLPLSVIVPTLNNPDRLMRRLEELEEAQALGSLEIVVVDDGHEVLDSMKIRERVVRMGGVYVSTIINRGFAHACNQGGIAASGEYVLFLNDDAELSELSLGAAISELVASEAGVGQLLSVSSAPFPAIEVAGVAFPHGGIPYAFARGLPDTLANRAALSLLGFHAVSGVAMIVKRAEFQDLKGFDPLFTNGMEDIDFCLRHFDRFQRKHKVLVSSSVTHEGIGSGGGRLRHIQRNRDLFMSRWRGRLPIDDDTLYDQLGYSILAYGLSESERVDWPTPIPMIRQLNRG